MPMVSLICKILMLHACYKPVYFNIDVEALNNVPTKKIRKPPMRKAHSKVLSNKDVVPDDYK